MTYARVDDHFTEHPKVLDIGPLAEALWLRGLLYASRNLTDGFIPMAYLRRMGDIDALEYARVLEQAGLWREDDGGYRVHDYEEWQRSKEDVAAISRVRAEAGRQGGLQRASNIANAKQVASLLRSKPLAEERREEKIRVEEIRVERAGADAPPKPKRATPIDFAWVPDDALILWSASEGFLKDERMRETQKFIDHFLANGKVMKDWGAAWKNWMRRSREWGPARASPNGTGAPMSKAMVFARMALEDETG